MIEWTKYRLLILIFAMSSRCAIIFFSVVFINIFNTLDSTEVTEIQANITTKSTNTSEITTNTGFTTTIVPNITKVLHENKNEGTVQKILIINQDTRDILRQSNRRPRRPKKGKAKELLYEERDYKGRKLKSVTMFNLDDVAQFFKEQLETEICYERCPGDE